MSKSTPTPSEKYRFEYLVRYKFSDATVIIYANTAQDALTKLNDIFERDDDSPSTQYNKYKLVMMEELR